DALPIWSSVIASVNPLVGRGQRLLASLRVHREGLREVRGRQQAAEVPLEPLPIADRVRSDSHEGSEQLQAPTEVPLVVLQDLGELSQLLQRGLQFLLILCDQTRQFVSEILRPLQEFVDGRATLL